MSRSWVMNRKPMYGIVSRHVTVCNELRRVTNRVDHRASRNLAKARAASPWEKIYGPDRLTSIGSFMESQPRTAGIIYMQAPNPMAIEFGHGPSGVFGPGGRFSHIKTRAPWGLYILSRAAGLDGSHVVASRPGTRRGK